MLLHDRACGESSRRANGRYVLGVNSGLIKGYAITYSSGLNAIHALFIHVNPKKVCISLDAGYHGTKGVANIIRRLNNLVLAVIRLILIVGNSSLGTFGGIIFG
jgi:hypothetical protein